MMQKTGSKKIVGGFALAAALMLTGIVGFAQQGTTQEGEQGGRDKASREWKRGGGGRHRGMKGGFGGRFAEQLNLTDAQKAQMQQIAARYHESAKALREQTRAARGARGGERGLFNGGTFDEAAVRAAAQQRANVQVEMEVQRARMMSEMYAVLTAEQKAQLAAAQQQREQRRQERRSRRGASGVQNQ